MRPPRTASARTELRTEPSEPDHTSARTGPNFRGTAAMRLPRTASARTELRTEPSEPTTRAHEPARISAARPPCDRHAPPPHERSCGRNRASARTGPNFRGPAANATATHRLRTNGAADGTEERTNRPELPRTGRHATAMKCTPRPSYTTRPDRTNGAADRDPNDLKKRVTDDLRAAAPGTFCKRIPMFYIYSLAALVRAAALIFAVPLRAKNRAALAIVLAGAIPAVVMAARALTGTAATTLWAFEGPPRSDGGSMDALSALFVLLIAIGGVAATLYAHGYLAHTLRRKSPAHVALHYTALVTMFYAMLGVVVSDGGYSFLFFWELMTVASFLLILYDAERREVLRAALSYLIMMHIGFLLLVVGFARLAAETGPPRSTP